MRPQPNRGWIPKINPKITAMTVIASQIRCNVSVARFSFTAAVS